MSFWLQKLFSEETKKLPQLLNSYVFDLAQDVKSESQMNEDKKLTVLLSVYTENSELARHHDNQRERITGIVAQTSGVLLGLLTISSFQTVFGLSFLLVGCFITIFGFLGFAFSWKHNERARLHRHRVRTLRKEMSKISGIDLRELNKSASRNHAMDYSRIAPESLRLDWIWKSFHLLIVVLGLVIVLTGLFFPKVPNG